MTYLILTHDAYRITSLVTLTLGSFYIANQIYERWLRKLAVNLIDANLLIKLLIVFLGCTVVSWDSLLSLNVTTELLGAGSGIVLGYICLALESYLLSIFQNMGNLALRSQNKNAASLKTILTSKPSYFSIIAVGSLEEIIYRGFLTALCLSLLSFNASIMALFGVTLLFALSHINFGVIHVLSKFILGVVCLLSFLITKTILAPVFIHSTFNALVINKYRKVTYG